MASTKHADRPNDARVPAFVRTTLCELLGVDEPEVTADSKLVDDLGADSLDVVELAIALEHKYGKGPLDDYGADAWTLGTVGDVVATLRKAGAHF